MTQLTWGDSFPVHLRVLRGSNIPLTRAIPGSATQLDSDKIC